MPSAGRVASASVRPVRFSLSWRGSLRSTGAGSFAEAMRRVLRPGGRLSIFEPINRFGHPEPSSRLWGFDVTGVEKLADRVKEVYRRYVDGTSPMLDFDERDLLRFAEEAGFTDLRLTYEATVTENDLRKQNECQTRP